MLNIDINKTEQAFINLGFADFHHMYNQHAANELFAALETGSVSTEEFLYPSNVDETIYRKRIGQCLECYVT
ncbi:MAG: hypothetical protein IPI98_00380 [Chitinophagaceae bacterium]|nr:hypothetical protein [Chitinophagaceae bacterium]